VCLITASAALLLACYTCEGLISPPLTVSRSCVKVKPKGELWPHHSSRMLKKSASGVLAPLRGSKLRGPSDIRNTEWAYPFAKIHCKGERLHEVRSVHPVAPSYDQEASRNLPTDSSRPFHALQGCLTQDGPRTQQALFSALFCTPRSTSVPVTNL